MIKTKVIEIDTDIDSFLMFNTINGGPNNLVGELRLTCKGHEISVPIYNDRVPLIEQLFDKF